MPVSGTEAESAQGGKVKQGGKRWGWVNGGCESEGEREGEEEGGTGKGKRGKSAVSQCRSNQTMSTLPKMSQNIYIDNTTIYKNKQLHNNYVLNLHLFSALTYQMC